MKAYYSGSSAVSSLVDGTTSSSTSSTEKNNAISVRDDSSALRLSSAALLQNGSKSVFNKTTATDEDGASTTEYNMDSIYKAVSSFVKNYNSTVESTGDSNNNAVLRAATTMVGNTKANSDLLSKTGITINSDNTLSIDEKTLKASNVSDIKSLFNGTGSYAYNTAASASQMYNQSVSQLAQIAGASYSSTGSYTYTGSTFSGYL